MATFQFQAWEESQELSEYLQAAATSACDTADTHAVLSCVENLLGAFVKENFTGPPHKDSEPLPGVGALGQPPTPSQHKKCMDHLMLDGEPVTPILKRGILLCTTLDCLEALYAKHVGTSSASPPATSTSSNTSTTPNLTGIALQITVWRMRAAWVYQRMLTNRCNTLRLRLNDCFGQLRGTKNNDFVSVLQLHLEIGNILDYYRETEQANQVFQRAVEISGLKFNLTGRMGVRTEHQEFKTAQLILQVIKPAAVDAVQPEPPQNPESYGVKPRLIQSEDCNILQKPSTRNLIFRDEEEDRDSSSNLQVVYQAMIVSLCLNVRNNNPQHGLTGEEMRCYIERLIECTNVPYVLWFMVLLIKCRLERTRATRVQERALLQRQELADAFLDVDEKGKPEGRFEHFYMTPLPSYYKLARESARHYLSLTMAKTAEEVAEQIQDWEFVVICCQAQGNRKRAEFIADRLLKEDPENALHWCAKAEATEEVKYFEKAWELSGCKLARAQRGLARLHLSRKEFKPAVQAFELALQMNPLYGANWFQLGYCCMMTEDWDRAIQAFTRCVQLDMEDGQGWNNLGTVYLKVKKLRQAFNAMGQAMKRIEFSWRVRENHYMIAAELEEWDQCVLDLMVLIQMEGHKYKIKGEVLSLVFEGLIKEVKKAKEILAAASQKQEEQLAESTKEEENDDFLVNPAIEEEEPSVPDVTIPLPSLTVTAPEEDSVVRATGLQGRVEALITKMDANFVDNAEVYGPIARFYQEFGPLDKELTFHLKEHRALCLHTGWELSHLDKVCGAVQRAVACEKRIASSDLTAEAKENAHKQVGLMLHNTVSRTRKENLDNKSDWYEKLQAMQDEHRSST